MAARCGPNLSRAPAKISFSITRLLTFFRSIRAQKSNRSLKYPPLLRASKIASIGPSPTPLIAPIP
ncbi:Uncharacterised protein [Vibrio cholerae]|uniref:Uncharacterized protein n=1 Tax=Vibrio cholerae TaxID=666 RepID=A0A655P6Q6_VIBCL|nr:Uncharacterised protein [Vibrio cholerae]CSA22296.1 Uncharacterised protein [Vibrio cholerae]CSC77551.1 Uncharacterised protein [Vibrio cholerae]CSD15762.1 Uncharacterised protein [Vibrio cholerae]